MRDPAFYERDTFNFDRIELLRGSASMLFGRGSTGGAVNQVSKQPRADRRERGQSPPWAAHNYRRVTGDFNLQTGENAACASTPWPPKPTTTAPAAAWTKKALPPLPLWHWHRRRVSVGLYDLQNDNGINYGMPWIKPTASAPVSATTINDKLDPSAYLRHGQRLQRRQRQAPVRQPHAPLSG
jgi:catecholate siderophore receptor